MTSFFISLIQANEIRDVSYAEPYAGGAGTAVNLLLDGIAERIFINDANVCIYSFWKYAIEESERFIAAVEETSVNLENWLYYHELVSAARVPSFELGFATFFLSRTNRSGILTAGPIGGRTEEKQANATYKIDCRFNKTNLISRLRDIARHRDSIVVSNADALDFLNALDRNTSLLVYLDPPYFNQGKSLYLNYYNEDDHRALSEYLSATDNFKWVLSYDNVPEIRKFYRNFDLYEFRLKYTAQFVKQGAELLTHSKDLIMPDDLMIRRKENNIKFRKINSNGRPSED